MHDGAPVPSRGESSIVGRPPQSASVHSILIQLVLACFLPGILTSSAMLYSAYRDAHEALQRDTVQTTRALMQAVDAELAKAELVAKILSTSMASQLTAKDFAAFHKRATAVLRQTEIGNNFVLSDATGQQLVNTIRPYPGPLARHGNPELLRRVFETGKPAISDIYIGGVLRRPVMSIDVPVWLNGKVAYDLSVGLFPESLGSIVRKQQLPPTWVVAIFDGKGVIAFRSHLADKFVGHKGSPDLLKQMAVATDGVVNTNTLEGIAVSSIFSRSPSSNWAVAIGIPTKELTGELQKRFVMLLVAITIFLAAGIALGTRLASRIARSIRALTAPAMALGSGEPVVVPQLDIMETEEVGAAIAAASNLLARTEALRRESDACLAATSHRLVAHMSNSPLAIIEFDSDFRVTRWSTEAERLFGWSASDILGHATLEMRWVYEDDIEKVQSYFAELVSGAKANNVCRNRNYRKNGAIVHCEWYNSALFDENGKLLSVLSQVLDVTDRDQAAAALASFAAEQNRAIEAERKHLAREVHDQIGQVFTAVKLIVSSLSREAFPPDQEAALVKALDMGIATTRKITAELRPPLLDDLGFAAALNYFSAETGKVGNLTFETNIDDQAALDATQALTLFRIAQEAYTNILRHADAEHVVVSGYKDGNRYIFSIEDDGHGFVLADVRKDAVGLKSMRERAQLLGGSCEIVPKPEGGTLVTVALPLSDNDANECAVA